jgi:hypothetical protein
MGYLRYRMKCSQKQIKITCILSSVFMILTLAWLTVSLPFVNAAQQQATEQGSSASDNPLTAEEGDNSNNPFGNTTEEKTSSNFNSLSEEDLHDAHSYDHYVIVPSAEYKLEHVSTYIAFHGELISPPPDFC